MYASVNDYIIVYGGKFFSVSLPLSMRRNT